jgi:hypothetical protein
LERLSSHAWALADLVLADLPKKAYFLDQENGWNQENAD